MIKSLPISCSLFYAHDVSMYRFAPCIPLLSIRLGSLYFLHMQTALCGNPSHSALRVEHCCCTDASSCWCKAVSQNTRQTHVSRVTIEHRLPHYLRRLQRNCRALWMMCGRHEHDGATAPVIQLPTGQESNLVLPKTSHARVSSYVRNQRPADAFTSIITCTPVSIGSYYVDESRSAMLYLASCFPTQHSLDLEQTNSKKLRVQLYK